MYSIVQLSCGATAIATDAQVLWGYTSSCVTFAAATAIRYRPAAIEVDDALNCQFMAGFKPFSSGHTALAKPDCVFAAFGMQRGPKPGLQAASHHIPEKKYANSLV